jgi:hypothetical protein
MRLLAKRTKEAQHALIYQELKAPSRGDLPCHSDEEAGA